MNPKKQLFMTAAVLLFIILSYLFLDQPAVWWSRTHVTPAYHELFTAITEFGDSTYYLIGFSLLFLLFRFLWKKFAWANIFLFLFATVAVSGIITDVIKVIAGRYRPSALFEQGLYGFDFFHIERALTSFPSGHTTTAFALATAITYLWPKTGIVMGLFAVVIGTSRLMICAHYPSDIIAGGFIGVAATLLLIHYWNRSGSAHCQKLKP